MASDHTDTRSWLNSLWATHGGFAALLPANRAAAVAFSDVHARLTVPSQNMMVSQGEKTLPEALAFYDGLSPDWTSDDPSTPQESNDSSFSSSGTDDEADLANTTVGAFVFSFEMMPLRRKLGWFVGLPLCAKFQTKAAKADVDMALTLNPSHGVASDHLLFSFLPDSNAFAIRNLRKDSHVTFKGEMIRSRKWAALLHPDAILVIGNLSYHVVLNVPLECEGEYLSRRNKYATSELEFEVPIASVSSTPKSVAMNVGPWQLRSSPGQGSKSVFFSAIGPRGELAVVKQLVRRDSRSGKDADIEIRQYEEIRDRLQHQPNREFVVGLRELIYSNGRHTFEQDQPADIVNLIFSPLGRGTFWDMLIHAKDTVDRYVALALFAQVLLGVSALHEVDYVHRDIKPTNLAVLSLRPPKAVVLDLDQARYIPNNLSKGVECTPGRGGTIGYHAPETEVAGGSYGQPTDAFALGSTGFHLFTGERLIDSKDNPFRRPLSDRASPEEMSQVRGRFDATLDGLKGGGKDPIQDLLLGLLQPLPGDRLTLADAIKHHAVAPVLPREKIQTGEKRQRDQ
ncbi:hypothetical protein LTR49_027875 [Elasticomyces elasticus]|nr:hypothetical protein LTR49_027875 [Elasticomyces elasticus]